MQEAARRFFPRAHRYTLRPNENCLIRFSGPHRSPWEEGTEIINISSTGLAFTTPDEICPMVGELIKIEFEVPAEAQVACFAKVVRLSPASSETQMVGVRFAHLTPAHKIMLSRGLMSRFKERKAEAWLASVRLIPWLILGQWKTILMWMMTALIFGVWIYTMNLAVWSPPW